MIPALLLLLVSSAPVEVADQVYRIPASEWRYLPVQLPDQPARISAEYQLISGGNTVRLTLVEEEGLELFRRNEAFEPLATTTGSSGLLKCLVPQAGNYALIVDNRAGGAPVELRLRVFAEYRPVSSLPRGRQLAVILISFAAFFGIVSLSARFLLRSLRRE
jgi:hypothetical protein